MKFKQSLALIASIILVAIAAVAQSRQDAQPAFNVVESNVNISISQGQTKTSIIHVRNTGTSSIALDFITTALDLIDNDGDRVAVTFSDPGVMPAGEEGNVTITVRTDQEIDFESYGGTVTVKDRNSSVTDTFTLDIVVTPDVCDFGEVPGDLEVTIDNPDDGEEVEPGEILDIKVNVRNNGRNDRRVQVEAFLFAESGRKVAEASSDSKNLNDGEDEDFKLEMPIPVNSETIGDVDDDFTLFVKAFDDDNERLACVQKSLAIDIEIPKKKIVIDKASSQFFPSAVSCGETAIANIRLINLGENDNTITLTIQNNELKIKKSLPPFRLESFNSEERNTATRQFEIEIPKTAKKKDYLFNLIANGDSGSVTSDLKLGVVSCEEKAFFLRDVKSDAIITLQKSEYTVPPGKTVVIPVEVTNNMNKKSSFTAYFRNVNDFARGSEKSAILNPGQKTTFYMDLMINPDASIADYSAILEVNAGSGPVASETITISVEKEAKEEATLASALKQLPFGFWIVLNIVLIGLILLAFKVVTTLR